MLVVATLAVYHRLRAFEFLTWDDDLHVTANPYFRHLSFGNVGRFWLAAYENLYIPVSYTFFAAEVWLSRRLSGDAPAPLNPAVFHVGSLLLHLVCVLLVYRLARRLVGQTAPALLAALLFSVHPLQVESVAWISETRGLLAALFCLLAIDQFLRFRTADTRWNIWSEQPAPLRDEGARWWHFAAATLACLLAVLAKPSSVALPVMLLIVDAGLLRSGGRRALVLLPWVVVAAAVVVPTKLFLQADQRISFLAPAWFRPLVAGDALAFYLSKLVWPAGLGFDYGRTPQRVIDGGWLYLAWLVPASVACAAAMLPGRRVWLSCYAMWLAALLPVLGFVPFLYQQISTVADRYAYLPMFAVALAVAALLARHWTVSRAAAAGLVLGGLAAASLIQTGHWRDDWSVYRRGLDVNPQSYVAHYSLGNKYLVQQRTAEAMAHYHRALAVNERYAPALARLGACHALEGRHDEAIAYLKAALEIMPEFAEAQAKLAAALAAQGQREAAIDAYREALRMLPTHVESKVNLADLLAPQEPGQALALLEDALVDDPDLAEPRFKYAELLARLGRLREAMHQLEEALALEPDFAAAHNNLGSLHWLKRDLTAARRHWQRAAELDPSLPDPQINLGLLEEEDGNHSAAVELYRRALALASPDSPQARQCRDALARLGARP